MAKRDKFHRSLKRDETPIDAETPAANLHQPVLLDECLRFLEVENGGLFVDCTLGLGGHTAAMLASSPETRVIGIDRDAAAMAKASERLIEFGGRFQTAHNDFRQIKTVLADLGATRVNGILADLGVSSWQLDDGQRGFSFRFDAPLDMRMNQIGDDATAAELLETLSEEAIANLIYEFGEERFSRRIARRIVERREAGTPVQTTAELAALVERSVKRNFADKIHPATRTFQALRIAVNRELENLDLFVRDAIDVLAENGKLAIISFHSLEDRIIKRAFRKLAGHCECPPRLPVCSCGATREIEILTARPITASAAEIAVNPRARSAKLRVCKRAVISNE